MKAIILFASLTAVTLASPARFEDRAAPSAACKAVSNLVSALTAQSSATAFCSSFLGIKTSTFSGLTSVTSTQTVLTTSTSTSTSITTTTDLITTTVATDVITASTSLSVVSSATTTTTTVTQNTFVPKAKREAATALEARWAATPAPLKNLANAAISTICSCLSIPTPTVTKISTSTAQATSTSVIVASQTTVQTTQVTSTVLATTTTTTTPVSLTTSVSVETDTATASGTCTSFYLLASSTASAFDGQYIQAESDETDIRIGSASSRGTFILSSGSSRHLTYASDAYEESSWFAFLVNEAYNNGQKGTLSIQDYDSSYEYAIACSIASSDGAFTCVDETAPTVPNIFQICDSPLYDEEDLSLSPTSHTGCTTITLFAEAAC